MSSFKTLDFKLKVQENPKASLFCFVYKITLIKEVQFSLVKHPTNIQGFCIAVSFY